METAAQMLTQAETAAKEAKVDAANSVSADSHDMTNIVTKAVKAAESAESLKIESLSVQRKMDTQKQDAAYRHALAKLDEKREQTIRLGEEAQAENQKRLKHMEMDAHDKKVQAIAEKMQTVASPQKLAELHAELVKMMHNKKGESQDVGEAKEDKKSGTFKKIAKMPREQPDIGEALPHKVSKDEQAFDDVLAEMKAVNGEPSGAHAKKEKE